MREGRGLAPGHSSWDMSAGVRLSSPSTPPPGGLAQLLPHRPPHRPPLPEHKALFLYWAAAGRWTDCCLCRESGDPGGSPLAVLQRLLQSRKDAPLSRESPPPSTVGLPFPAFTWPVLAWRARGSCRRGWLSLAQSLGPLYSAQRAGQLLPKGPLQSGDTATRGSVGGHSRTTCSAETFS